MKSVINRVKTRIAAYRRAGRLDCFLHIPKTAGTSLVAALHDLYGEDRSLRIDVPGDVAGHSKEEMTAACDLIHGHMGWSVAEPLATRMFTVLRDPIDRVLSLYNYWRSTELGTATIFDGERIDPAVLLARELSFDDFVRSDHRRIRNDILNGQSLQIAASNDDQGRAALAHLSNDALFDRVMDHLGRMDAVGRVEDLDGFAHRLRRDLGIALHIERHNETVTKTTLRAEVSDATLAHLTSLNSVDLRVYETLARA